MDARWQQIEALLDAVLEVPAPERAAYLNAHCGDAAVHQEVEALAEAYDEAQSFLEAPIGDEVAPLLPASGDPDLEGRRIGPYRLLQRIARGGMGTVCLAARADEQFEKKVALKLIRRGLDTEDVLRRFLAERQILARLEHPHIARLHDGGLSEDGRPYFVMEYVEGIPIDQYSDTHRLSIRERLALFLKVCDAVQYAHQNLIVHRDIKPSNILVAATGQVKLLDFGIAKVLAEDEDAVALTRTGVRVMTPEYAAPEQIQGRDVTTATDVYALGVLLYRLLVGRLPYHLENRSVSQIEAAVLSQEPERLTTAITRETAPAPDTQAASPTPEAISRARKASISSLRRQLAGDLDTIARKALRKEPARRYASVEAFAEDIRLHLGGLPVKARPDTLMYRTTKFVRRHRWGVTSAAVITLLLVSYAVTTQVQARRLAQEQQKTEQVLGFLVDLFKLSDPSEARGDTLTVYDALAHGAQQIRQGWQGEPDLRARMLSVIGEVYLNLALYDEARPLIEEALAVRRAAYGSDHADVAESLHQLANFFHETGDYTAADSLFRQALALHRQHLSPVHPKVAENLNNLGLLLQDMGQYETADSLLREALALNERVLGGDSPEVAMNLSNRAIGLQRLGNYEAAEPLFRRALQIQQQHHDEAHPDLAMALNNLGILLKDTGAFDAADSLLHEAFAMNRQLYAEAHPRTALSLNNLALLYEARGDYDRADSLHRRTVILIEALHGTNHPRTAMALNNLALMKEYLGDYEEAATLYRRTLAIQQHTLGEQHPDLATALNNLGMVLWRAGHLTEAEDHLRQALIMIKHTLGDQHPYTALTLNNLANVVRGQRRYTEADTFFAQALATSTAANGSDHMFTAWIHYYTALLRHEQGDYEAAERLYQQAQQIMTTALPGHPRTAAVLADYGRLLLDRERPARAEPLLRESYTIRQASLPPEHWQTAEVQSLLGACLAAQGHPTEAEPLLASSVDILEAKLGPQHHQTQAALHRAVAFYELTGRHQKASTYRARLQEANTRMALR